MGDVHYMISEAAKQVGVESHVLRYWEEELNLPIGRTDMGHRHYTKEDIQLFCCIKELKNQGIQLKDLKGLIPDLIRTREILKAKNNHPKEEPDNIEQTSESLSSVNDAENLSQDPTLAFRAAVQEIITGNNQVLEELITRSVSEKVNKNMNFLLQAKERQEEDRFRKLDHLIRQQQSSRREAARPAPVRYLHKIFGET
ncbi:MAG: helix-turn-helix domain-containing protein [Bariatricus sp.]